MKAKILACVLPVLILATIHVAEAQQAKEVPRIGILQGSSALSSKGELESFRKGLNELGYTEGKNILLEYRYAEGKPNRLSELAVELVRLKVEVILTAGTQTTTAAKQATGTIPIVAAGAGDLVGTGLVTSLARPGGNVTGLTVISPDLSGKRLELLTEIVPKASRVAVLLNPDSGTDRDETKQIERAAQSLKVEIQLVEVRGPADFQSGFATMRHKNAKALILIQSSLTTRHRKELAELGVKNRLPMVCESERWANDGCLISYGPNLLYQYHRAAVFVDKILKGTKPADIPVEQPTKFEFVINLKVAKQIGLVIPQSVLYRADKVIK